MKSVSSSQLKGCANFAAHTDIREFRLQSGDKILPPVNVPESNQLMYLQKKQGGKRLRGRGQEIFITNFNIVQRKWCRMAK